MTKKYGEHITNPRRAVPRLQEMIRWGRKIDNMINGAKFDLNSWWSVGESGYAPPEPPRSTSTASDCGFSGCLAGWCALNPKFRKNGLRLTRGLLDITAEGSEYEGIESTFLALAKFFGISYCAAEAVFGSTSIDWQEGASIDADIDYRVARLDPHDPSQAVARAIRFCESQGIEIPEEE